jgi:hypothetical protein
MVKGAILGALAVLLGFAIAGGISYAQTRDNVRECENQGLVYIHEVRGCVGEIDGTNVLFDGVST